jgi:hypothetical protein
MVANRPGGHNLRDADIYADTCCSPGLRRRKLLRPGDQRRPRAVIVVPSPTWPWRF